jgi:L-2-hydroxyglutarate oxidase LhgO
MLYDFCASHGVPHRKCGKLIVATNAAEAKKLETIAAQGGANGVEGLALIGGRAARALEPALSCVAALQSPETGIVDSHGFMLALRGGLEESGGAIAFNTPVEALARKSHKKIAGQWSVRFGGGDAGMLAFDAVVNCAGLQAQAVARRVEDYPAARIPRLVLAKGNYFSYSGRPVFSRLIYPTPVDGGLGVHVTLDLSGRMRFGPDVEWITQENYDVDPARAASFYARVRTYWPELPDNTLAADYSGIRPKLSGPGEPIVDFVIEGPRQHGLPGLVQMFGIESPGLTSALSLAEETLAYLES